MEKNRLKKKLTVHNFSYVDEGINDRAPQQYIVDKNPSSWRLSNGYIIRFISSWKNPSTFYSRDAVTFMAYFWLGVYKASAQFNSGVVTIARKLMIGFPLLLSD